MAIFTAILEHGLPVLGVDVHSTLLNERHLLFRKDGHTSVELSNIRLSIVVLTPASTLSEDKKFLKWVSWASGAMGGLAILSMAYFFP